MFSHTLEFLLSVLKWLGQQYWSFLVNSTVDLKSSSSYCQEVIFQVYISTQISLEWQHHKCSSLLAFALSKYKKLKLNTGNHNPNQVFALLLLLFGYLFVFYKPVASSRNWFDARNSRVRIRAISNYCPEIWEMKISTQSTGQYKVL